MTREEASNQINDIKTELAEHLLKKDIEALDMAISALEKNESAEEWYKLFCEKWDEGELVCHVPKGMTNGEVIKALFPNMGVHVLTEDDETIYEVDVDDDNYMSFTEKFWNSPYKKGE